MLVLAKVSIMVLHLLRNAFLLVISLITKKAIFYLFVFVFVLFSFRFVLFCFVLFFATHWNSYHSSFLKSYRSSLALSNSAFRLSFKALRLNLDVLIIEPVNEYNQPHNKEKAEVITFLTQFSYRITFFEDGFKCSPM